MITFLVLAAVLIVIGVAAVAVPLLKSSPNAPAPATWAALGAAGVLVIGSAVLYVTWSNWSWHSESEAADSPRTMVARLARKLEKNPNDLKGWLLLGQSYAVLEEYPLSARAYQRADRIAGGKSADALVGEAEALVLGDASEIDGRAGKLVEQALVINPDSGKALFYGAAAAERRGDLSTARDRFTRLLAQNPPANVRPLIEQQITAINQAIAQKSGAPTASSAAPAAGKHSPTVADSGAAGAAPAVRVHVTLAPKLASSASETTPLFVFVRDPQQPGPPLAVKRLTSRFPQTVELTQQDSMVPGRMFSAGQKVQVVARIARSGNPLAGKGDPFGETPYLVGHDGLVNVVIDQLSP